MARDAAGNLLIADTVNNRIRVIATHTGTFYGQAMSAGDIYTVAGSGTAGFSGDGGPAGLARLSQPGGAAVDSAGNLLIADDNNARVRVVAARTGMSYGKKMTAGDIYTAAGTGLRGEGDNGPALKAQFSDPQAVAVDAAGNLVIGDPGSERVRVVAARTGRFYGRAMTAGDVYSIAGNGTFGSSGNGGPATKADLDPIALTLDAAGNVLIAAAARPRAWVVAEKTGRFYGRSMRTGDIYVIAGSGRVGFAGDGGQASTPACSTSTGSPSTTPGTC